MNYLKWIFLIGVMCGFVIAGCKEPMMPVLTHKLVVTGNQHSIPLYPDEEAYLHTSHEKQSGGLEGVVGDVKQNLTAKQMDDQTPVQIVKSDDYGSVVTVTDGPMKGQSGFVAKQNID